MSLSVAELSLRDTVRSLSQPGGAESRVAVSLHSEDPGKVALASSQDSTWTPTW